MARIKATRFTAAPVVTTALTKPARIAASTKTMARRLRKHTGAAVDSDLIVVCPQCGDCFSIAHEVPCLDPCLAQRHAQWLLDQFVWDHIQENKHRGSIPLPNADELTRWTRSNRDR